MPPIILASNSPYRLELLHQAGIEAVPPPSHIPEPDLATFPDLAAGPIDVMRGQEASWLDDPFELESGGT